MLNASEMASPHSKEKEEEMKNHGKTLRCCHGSVLKITLLYSLWKWEVFKLFPSSLFVASFLASLWNVYFSLKNFMTFKRFSILFSSIWKIYHFIPALSLSSFCVCHRRATHEREVKRWRRGKWRVLMWRRWRLGWLSGLTPFPTILLPKRTHTCYFSGVVGKVVIILLHYSHFHQTPARPRNSNQNLGYNIWWSIVSIRFRVVRDL